MLLVHYSYTSWRLSCPPFFIILRPVLILSFFQPFKCCLLKIYVTIFYRLGSIISRYIIFFFSMLPSLHFLRSHSFICHLFHSSVLPCLFLPLNHIIFSYFSSHSLAPHYSPLTVLFLSICSFHVSPLTLSLLTVLL